MHTDGVFRCTYTLDSRSTAGTPYAIMEVRGATDFSDLLRVVFYDEYARVYERRNSTNYQLAQDTSVDSTLDQAYDVTVVLDGDHMEVWRGVAGGTQTRIFAEDGLNVLEGERVRLVAAAYTYVLFDDAELDVPDPETVTYEYNTANELTKMTQDGTDTFFTYDEMGRTVSKYQGDGSVTHAEYTWFAGNKLKQVNSTFPGEESLTQFNYDGLGKRRNKYVNLTELTWYRCLGSSVIARYAGDGSWTIGDRTDTIFPGRAHVSGNPLTGDWQYYALDMLGNSRALFDGQKQVAATAEFLPFGASLQRIGWPVTHGLAGAFHDEETGLCYRPARYYSPTTCRWLSRDPSGMIDGPNVYAFCKKRPSMAVDMDGRRVYGPTEDEGHCGSDTADGFGIPEDIMDYIGFPDDPGMADFGQCCEKHDNCYPCETQGYCDSHFLECMQSICAGAGFSNEYNFVNCLHVADGYYLAVVLMGRTAWENSRGENLEPTCCEEEDYAWPAP